MIFNNLCCKFIFCPGKNDGVLIGINYDQIDTLVRMF